MASTTGFVLGDHTFLDPSVNGPLSRLRAPKRQIKNAPPPTILDRIARESTPASPAARELMKGNFCGHGEPTMTVFDVVIDGTDVLECGAIADDETESGRNIVLLAARKPGGQWFVLFRREWEDAQATLVDVAQSFVTPAEAEQLEADQLVVRISIGFEYPCDADSRDTITWMAVDVLEEGKKKPFCIVNAEMA